MAASGSTDTVGRAERAVPLAEEPVAARHPTDDRPVRHRERPGGVGVLVERRVHIDAVADPDGATERVLRLDGNGDLPPRPHSGTECIERDGRSHAQTDPQRPAERGTGTGPFDTGDGRRGTPDLGDRQVGAGQDVTGAERHGRDPHASRRRGRPAQPQSGDHRESDEHDPGQHPRVDRRTAEPKIAPDVGHRDRHGVASRSEPVTGTTTIRDDSDGNGSDPQPIGVSVHMADELPHPLLKPADVARVLNVTVTQVYTLMRSGDLPALKIGRKGVWRVSRETLDEYLSRLEVEARSRTPVIEPTPD